MFIDDVIRYPYEPTSTSASLLQHYFRLSITDPLTGTYNKRFLMYYTPDNCYVCMIDINDFKSINDTVGHVDADFVLVDICKIIQSELQSDDILIRFGGDEFLAFFFDDGIDAIERKLSSIQRRITALYKNSIIHPKISYGIARHIAPIALLDTIRTADSLMYASRGNVIARIAE